MLSTTNFLRGLVFFLPMWYDDNADFEEVARNGCTVCYFSVVIVIAALIMIATVLLQGNVRGLGAITGPADSYFSKNKAKTVEAKLALITKISAAVFVVLSLALLIVDKLA